MATANASYFDLLIEPVAQCFSPEIATRLASLNVDPSIQTRIADLASKANEGTLTEQERADYEDYVDAVDMIGVLQARARAALKTET